MKVDNKFLEGFRMWWGGRRRSVGPIMWKMKKNYKEARRKEYHSVIKRRNANWINHICCKKCDLKDVIQANIEGRIEGTEWQGMSLKQLLDDCEDTRSYWKLKEIFLCKGLWICRKADYVLMTSCAAIYMLLLIKCEKAELWEKTWDVPGFLRNPHLRYVHSLV
jgi:hypothetical protein